MQLFNEPLISLQPKWEQAVRRVLWNDEHVVFAVLGGWVSLLLRLISMCSPITQQKCTVLLLI